MSRRTDVRATRGVPACPCPHFPGVAPELPKHAFETALRRACGQPSLLIPNRAGVETRFRQSPARRFLRPRGGVPSRETLSVSQ